MPIIIIIIIIITIVQLLPRNAVAPPAILSNRMLLIIIIIIYNLRFWYRGHRSVYLRTATYFNIIYKICIRHVIILL